MKKTLLVLACFLVLINLVFPKTKVVNAESLPNFSIDVLYGYKHFRFDLSDYNVSCTIEQMKHYHKKEELKKLQKMGFSKREIVEYVFPETKEIVSFLCKKINIDALEENIFVEKNKCKLFFDGGRDGIYLDQEYFYNELFEGFLFGQQNLKLKIKTITYKENSKRLNFVEKGCFSTNFSTSSSSRKNNIKVALESFDGIILDEGEILSFNNITGARNEDSGYQKAKIISNGTFIEGFGGGVCQVSTTLYNACLLAGLEILEVNSHSLPVSYVEPGFDAMVNSGSSDLVVRNNSGGKIIITTSSIGDMCRVKIFGKENKYKITRFSEKIKIIPAEPDVVETDFEKFGEFDLLPGEEKRISYAKDGFISKSYLNFYDKTGKIIETKQIRENKYYPTKGIIVKKEA